MDFNRYFASRRGELLNTLKKVVALESPTSDKKAVDACSAFVVAEFRKTGARITRYPQKDIGDLHLVEYAPRGPEVGRRRRILVLTHVDTVWPVGKIGKMPFYVSGDKVFGPGRPGHEGRRGHGPVRPQDPPPAQRRARKRGSRSSSTRPRRPGTTRPRAVIRDLARKSSLVLCLEPALPGGALKLERKGRLVVRLEARGRPAHARHARKGSQRHRGAGRPRSAGSRSSGPARSRSTSASVGGGEKANVVAESAWAVLDVRFWKSRRPGEGPGLFPRAPARASRGRRSRSSSRARRRRWKRPRASAGPLRPGPGDRRGPGADRSRAARPAGARTRRSRRAWASRPSTASGPTATASTPSTSTSSSPRSWSGRPS